MTACVSTVLEQVFQPARLVLEESFLLALIVQDPVEDDVLLNLAIVLKYFSRVVQIEKLFAKSIYIVVIDGIHAFLSLLTEHFIRK